MLKITALVALLGTVAVSLPRAQVVNAVVPAGHGYESRAGREGIEIGSWFAPLLPTRIQQVFDRQTLPFAAGRIDAVALRRSEWTTNPPGARVPLDVRMGYSNYEPRVMPQRFDLVPNGQTQLVFSGAVNLPAAGNWSPTFDLPIPLTVPFFFNTALGHLLIDFEFGGFQTTVSSRMNFDMHRETDPTLQMGTRSTFMTPPATGCSSISGINEPCITWLRDPQNAVPGGTLVLDSHPWESRTVTTTVNIVGTARLATPFDLAPFGAPGCRLMVAPLVVAPGYMYRDSIAHMRSAAHYALPPTLRVGTRLYTQWIGLDAGANPGGLAISSAAEIVLGRMGNVRTPVQALRGTPTYPFGTTSGATGLIVQFTGLLL